MAPANVPEGGGYVDVRCREAMELWRSEARRALERTPETATACLHVLKLGPVVFAGVNAEVFSVMAERLRQAAGWERLYVVGYADGLRWLSRPAGDICRRWLRG